jgi:lipoprotein-anchoring transpeptidase ErfK/SrfK
MDAITHARTARAATLRIPFLALMLACIAPPVLAQSAPMVEQGAVAGTDADAEADAVQPGQYLWTPERGGAGQLVVVVSIPAQRAHVYRNGVRIGVTTVSTGTESHPTPTGTFEILQKKEMHRSNLYNDAPMPYMQRLTWDGIALHAGKIPGYPASHGCVRLPLAFAKLLFGETQKGMLVVIADDLSHGPEVLYPGARSPVDTYTGLPLPQDPRNMGVATAAP